VGLREALAGEFRYDQKRARLHPGLQVQEVYGGLAQLASHTLPLQRLRDLTALSG
jgi:hypothetical protein